MDLIICARCVMDTTDVDIVFDENGVCHHCHRYFMMMKSQSQGQAAMEALRVLVEKIKADGLLNDQFYLNYEVDNIDFEAIMISSFINFAGGHFQESAAGKMGVTISELKTFYQNLNYY